ncbi:CotO family spore coat protein [Bacillus sp. Marseille-Q1617]|uniref:CotO family spore coat protein n=1 Tax=Bacillus sp. Marseille-Q1617 TaxID=2736887 RepID=UPI00158BC7CA|nr:CotO family spore coat protein [Bacillus sp. Marseille-Q1617]
MKKEKASSKEPLLYIQQPKLQEVKGNMQVTYRSTKSKEKKEKLPTKPIQTQIEKPHEEAESSRLKKPEIESKEQAQPHQKPSGEESQSAIHSFRRLKPFKELTLDEKLEYITASINGKVPFPCEFGTETATYKGVLISMDESTIKIKTFRGDEETIARDSLKSIKMIGLQ